MGGKLAPGVNVFALIAYSSGLIWVFGGVGAVIGLIVAFSNMASEMSGYGLIGALVIMLVGGIGMVAGAAIGILVAIVIGLKTVPNKTKGDYARIIGIPLIMVLIIVGGLVFGLGMEEYSYDKARRERAVLVTLLRADLPSSCPYYRTTVGTYYDGKGFFDGENFNAHAEGGGDPAKFHTQEFQLSRVHELHEGWVYFTATAKRGEYYDENSKIPYYNSVTQETYKETWGSIYKRANIDTYDLATGKWVAGAFSREVQILFEAGKGGSVRPVAHQFGTCYTRSEEFLTLAGISGNQ